MTDTEKNIEENKEKTNNLPLFQDQTEPKMETTTNIDSEKKVDEKNSAEDTSSKTLNINENIQSKQKQQETIKKVPTPQPPVKPVETPNVSLGTYVQEARVKAGYSLNQVAMITKLNIHYLEAIERDDFKNTPPVIYIRAYLKKLCSVYNIDEEVTMNLLNTPANEDSHLSERLMYNLEGTKQTNREHEEKIEFVLKIVIALIVVVFFIGIGVGTYFWIKSNNSEPLQTITQLEKEKITDSMENLIEPQSISMTELSIKEK